MKLQRHLVSVISIGLLTLVSVPKASSQPTDTPSNAPNQPNQAYPPEIVKIYMDNCVNSGGAAIEPFCACTIEKIQDSFTLDEFIQIGQELQEGKPAPQQFDEIIQVCLSDG